jgi:DNA-binding transcriptional MerR regulator
VPVKRKSALPQLHHMRRNSHSQGYLKIGDVARLVGISASALRSWERLGLVRPPRTGSQYRLFTSEDVKVLKRAVFLRRLRGLNPPAIVHLLKEQGLLRQTRPAPNGAIAIGRRMRALRLERGLSLAAVAGKTLISVGFLSALERGQMSASVGTLRKLARFYNISTLDLFSTSEANPRRVRPEQRKRLQAGPGVWMELLAWGNAVMEPHLFRIAPGAGSGDSYTHEGEEFLFMLRGQLEISLDDGEKVRLNRGDSFYFESSVPHCWSNPGRKETWVLWVNTPPTF